MLSEEKLIGWLCFFRYQIGAPGGGGPQLPGCVVQEFADRGWIRPACADPIRGTNVYAEMTEKGNAICDLESPEWGIDIIGEVKAR